MTWTYKVAYDVAVGTQVPMKSYYDLATLKPWSMPRGSQHEGREHLRGGARLTYDLPEATEAGIWINSTQLPLTFWT